MDLRFIRVSSVAKQPASVRPAIAVRVSRMPFVTVLDASALFWMRLRLDCEVSAVLPLLD